MSTRNRISNEELVRTYQPLVRRIALNMVAKLPRSVDVEDLFQAGTMGLLDAATRYDASHGHGADLATYAAKRIRGAMIDLLRIDDPVSRVARKEHREVVRATERLSQRLGRRPTTLDVSEEMDIPLHKLHNLQTEVGRFNVSVLPEPGSDSAVWDPTELEIARADRDSSESLYGDEDPFDTLAVRQMLEHIYKSSAKLTERQHEALGHYLRANSLGGTAEAMEVTKSRVRQLWNELVRKLRVILREEHGYDVPSPNADVDMGTEREPRSPSKKKSDADITTEREPGRG